MRVAYRRGRETTGTVLRNVHVTQWGDHVTQRPHLNLVEDLDYIAYLSPLRVQLVVTVGSVCVSRSVSPALLSIYIPMDLDSPSDYFMDFINVSQVKLY